MVITRLLAFLVSTRCKQTRQPRGHAQSRLFANAFWIAPLLLLTAHSINAAPTVLLEEARLEPSDGAPDGGFGRSSDIQGDVAVVGATQGGGTAELAARGAAYVYERQSDGTWVESAKLLPLDEAGPGEGNIGNSNFGISVAVEGDSIVVGSHSSQETAVFERSGGIWSRVATLTDTDGFFVDMYNGTIITSHETGGDLYRRSSGAWTKVQRLSNGEPDYDPDYRGANVAISATTAIHGSNGFDDPNSLPSTAFIYPLGSNGTWPPSSGFTALTHPTSTNPVNGFSSLVAISDDTAIIGGANAYIYERNAQGVWNNVQTIPDGGFSIDGNTIAALTDEGLVYVYRRTTSGDWDHQATLVSSTGERLGKPNIRGDRVIAGRFIYTLPAVLGSSPAPIQEDLEDNVANNWLPHANSTFSIVSASGTKVYRQTNLTTGASATYEGADWEQQSIQADVTPRAYATPAGERWFGLMVRYTDASNYYYITVRNSNSVHLKRMVNGQYQTLAQATLPVALNRTYSLRLEAQGDVLRVFVDNELLLNAHDTALSHGRAGVAMFKTRADFDNLIISPNPLHTLLSENFDLPSIPAWENFNQSLPWAKEVQDDVFSQPSTGGGAYAVTGLEAGDQMISARMRATAISGADRWFGLLGRVVDANNYYYVTFRSSNTIWLRKLTNGVATTLDTAPLAFTVGTWYSLRLEIVGTRLRVYANDKLVLEATDTSIAAGRYGVGGYKAAMEADDFVVRAP